jgi:hypothetical protein
VLTYLDGRSLARAECACRGLLAAAEDSPAWIHALTGDCSVTCVDDGEDRGGAEPSSELGSAAAAGGRGRIYQHDAETARNARGAYKARMRTRVLGTRVNAEYAAAWSSFNRQQLPRVAVWGTVHVLHALLGVAAPPVLFLTGLVLLVMRLDGAPPGFADWTWQGLLGVLACAPGALLVDGALAALVAVVRRASRECTRRDVCRYAGCDGPWRPWFYDQGSGGDGDSCVKFSARNAYYATYLGALTALPLLIGTKLEGGLSAWPWAALCFPIFIAIPMTCGLALIGAVGMDDDEVSGPLIPMRIASLLLACILMLCVLPTVACVVAKLDGGDFAWLIAFIPIWVFDLLVLAFQTTTLIRWVLSGEAPRGCRGVAAVLAIVAAVDAVDAALMGSPLLIVLKLEGLYAGPWTLACMPLLVTTAAATLGALASGAVFAVSVNKSMARVCPPQRLAPAAARTLPWRTAGAVQV